MWRMAKLKNRHGFAMIIAILIAVAMIIPAMIIATTAVTRRKAISGESISDRSLSVADATIDRILNEINTFDFTFTTPTIIDSNGDVDEAEKEAQDYLIGYYLSKINGGMPDTDDPVGSLATIKNNVSTLLYNLSNQHYYAVWDTTNNKVAAVGVVGPAGDITTHKIKDLNDGTIYDNILALDSKYKEDNLWIEIDVRADYDTDQWIITDTAYLLSRPNIKRTIQAIAKRGKPTATGAQTTEEKANGNWYTRETSTETTTVYFSDFSGLYHTKVYFGRYETTKGIIRSDSNLYMGGWAHDPVYANGRVYDMALDHGWRHDGRFGPDKKSLSWAKSHGYAIDNYPKADWPNGDKALFGSSPVRDPTDPEGGLQDKADKDAGYYIDGDATIVFSVENGVGKVTINGVKLDMPANGAIFVSGDATVSGTVKGRCTVGAGHKMYIGGNIVYSTPPRINKDDPVPPEPPDSLGLISYGSIIIPKSTFDAHHHLRIDAAMLSVHGSFGIASDVPWHYINGSGEYEAWWNGCQAEWNTNNAPALISGRYVKGYDIQHTNYDWNLYNFGPPPFYPPTNSRSETHHNVRYVIVTDSGTLNTLRNLNKSDLVKISPNDPDYNPNYPYKYYYNGKWYYYGTQFNVVSTASATAQMNGGGMYRISWKEQIAKPVKP